MRVDEKRIRILHVDDEAFFLDSTKAFMEKKNVNFSIDTATSAEAGLELLKDGIYDVVVSDYKMPGMDGLEFLQHLRVSGNTVPFIILTGKGREEVAMEALNRGANHYLQKGGDVKSLYETLAHVIREEAGKKRTEGKLAEIEKERQVILDSVPAMIFHKFYKDSDSVFIYVNKHFADACGMNQDDFMGKSTREIFPEEAEGYIKTDKEVVESGIPKTGIIEEFHTQEGKRWVRLDKVPIRDDDGNVTGIIGFELDMTKRKAAEDALRKSEEEYRSLVESTEDSVYLVDRNCRYLFANEKHLSKLGLPVDKVIGKTYGEFHSGEDTKEFAERVNYVLETGKSALHEYKSRRSNRYFLRTLSKLS